MESKKIPDVVLFILVIIYLSTIITTSAMSPSQKKKIKEQVLQMFDHAYGSYMKHAYPADELMPLSCKGRYRGTKPSRGDVDDTLGNFTLTLIDSLDSLAVLGKLVEFETAVQNVIRDAKYDADIIVSVFETNIRILGGLLGGHVVASYLKKKKKGMMWYNQELLDMAKEVGDRLMPAFNTTTGIPYPRINLRSGINDAISTQNKDTCTACAGTMILEFAALSRLSGDPRYEMKAQKAMDFLWNQRHHTSDLMGMVINIHNGDWIRRESGVGAGIDSYYEYVLKAYILLGDETYLDRFNKHYDAVMRYVSQGPLLVDVHMHKPEAVSRNFMDSLLAFWPGLQVLKGDIGPAVETHEMLYQVMQRHNFLPEAFTTDFRIHWGHHPLRPEFVESTYFLYKATGDAHYLDVGKLIIDNLEKHARVPCGYAAIKDLTKGTHEDQMDSYMLAETFKYLYLLFSEPEDHVLPIDDYIFTTEAHLLPLSLSLTNKSKSSAKIEPESYRNLDRNYDTEGISEREVSNSECRRGGLEMDANHNTCPNLQVMLPGGQNYAYGLRHQMKNLVNKVSPPPHRERERLKAGDFIAGNKEQLDILHRMGIRIQTMTDGRVQLLHTASEAASPADAEDGMRFMQEMIELSKTQTQEGSAQHDPMFVKVLSPNFSGPSLFKAGPAQFGYNLKESPPADGQLAVASPFKACTTLMNPNEVFGKIVLLERGECMFVDKARNLEKAGAVGGIVVDHNEGSSVESQALFAMSGDGKNDITIPMVFLFEKEGSQLISAVQDMGVVRVSLQDSNAEKILQPLPPDGSQPEESGGSPYIPDQTPPYHNAPMRGGDQELPVSFQVESRQVHMKVKVSEGSGKNEVFSSVDRDNDDRILKVVERPDGSIHVGFSVDDNDEEDDKVKKDVKFNDIYSRILKTLREKTNFDTLTDRSEYLNVIARFLESSHVGIGMVDSTLRELIEKLASELMKEGQASKQTQRVEDGRHYASQEDFAESGSHFAKLNTDVKQSEYFKGHIQQDSSVNDQQKSEFTDEQQSRSSSDVAESAQTESKVEDSSDSSGYLVYTTPDHDSENPYGATIDDHGILNLAIDKENKHDEESVSRREKSESGEESTFNKGESLHHGDHVVREMNRDESEQNHDTISLENTKFSQTSDTESGKIRTDSDYNNNDQLKTDNDELRTGNDKLRTGDDYKMRRGDDNLRTGDDYNLKTGDDNMRIGDHYKSRTGEEEDMDRTSDKSEHSSRDEL